MLAQAMATMSSQSAQMRCRPRADGPVGRDVEHAGQVGDLGHDGDGDEEGQDGQDPGREVGELGPRHDRRPYGGGLERCPGGPLVDDVLDVGRVLPKHEDLLTDQLPDGSHEPERRPTEDDGDRVLVGFAPLPQRVDRLGHRRLLAAGSRVADESRVDDGGDRTQHSREPSARDRPEGVDVATARQVDDLLDQEPDPAAGLDDRRGHLDELVELPESAAARGCCVLPGGPTRGSPGSAWALFSVFAGLHEQGDEDLRGSGAPPRRGRRPGRRARPARRRPGGTRAVLLGGVRREEERRERDGHTGADERLPEPRDPVGVRVDAGEHQQAREGDLDVEHRPDAEDHATQETHRQDHHDRQQGRAEQLDDDHAERDADDDADDAVEGDVECRERLVAHRHQRGHDGEDRDGAPCRSAGRPSQLTTAAMTMRTICGHSARNRLRSRPGRGAGPSHLPSLLGSTLCWEGNAGHGSYGGAHAAARDPVPHDDPGPGAYRGRPPRALLARFAAIRDGAEGAGRLPARRRGRGGAVPRATWCCRTATRPTCRSSPSTRRARWTSTRRCTSSGRGTGTGCGTPSPTCPRSSPRRRARPEARRRGQTVYAPDERTPLHPPVIGEEAGSLLPDQVRPAFVWDMRARRPAARRTRATVYRARVRSRARLDYVGVQQAVDERDGRGEPVAAQGDR